MALRHTKRVAFGFFAHGGNARRRKSVNLSSFVVLTESSHPGAKKIAVSCSTADDDTSEIRIIDLETGAIVAEGWVDAIWNALVN